MRAPSSVSAAALGFGLAIAPVAARGALFIVDTTTVDLGDIAPGDGQCAWATFPPLGQRCTLRAAVAEANALPGADVILMPAGMEIDLENGEIEIASDVTIGSLEQGAARPILDAGEQSRIFRVAFVPTSVTIGNLVLRNGRALGGQQQNAGGAIDARDGDFELVVVGCAFTDNGAGGGGAIVALNSELRIEDSSFSGNFLSDPEADVNPFGSAVWIAGGVSASIERSTFSSNYTLRAAGGPALDGVTNALQIENSTFDGNNGGGIRSPSPEVTIVNGTISDNAPFGIEVNGAGSVSFTVRDSIVAGNEVGCAMDVGGILFTSAGYSLDQDGSCDFFPGGGNLSGVDPLLAPIAANGGPTRTRSLLPGSPALDAGDPATPGGVGACLATDQRGVARPQAAGAGPARCDMGAVEVPEPDAHALGAIALLGLAGMRALAMMPRWRSSTSIT